MIKINFNTPLPKNQRDDFIRCMKSLGFSYERIIQSGEYSLHRFVGELPQIGSDDLIEFVICADGKNKTDLLKLFLKNVRCEIIIPFEREEKNYEVSNEK